MRHDTFIDNFEGLFRFIVAIAAALLLCGLLGVLADSCTRDAHAENPCPDNSDECWQKYNAEAERGMAEAGKPTVEPKKKTVIDGLKNGQKWCTSPKARCYKAIRVRTQKRMDEYGPWFIKYSGGRLPEHIAMISSTESPVGPAQCSPDKVLEECGLMGTKESMAEKCDVNVADPEASIWCSSYMANKRMLKLVEKYPQLKQSPRDWYMLSGLVGSMGTMAMIMIKDSHSLDVKADGTLKHKSPHGRIMNWLKWIHKYQPENIGKLLVYARFKEHKIGFKLGRQVAVLKIIEGEYYPDGITFKTPVLIPRPEHLPAFPGKKLHGRFDKFPDMVKHKP